MDTKKCGKCLFDKNLSEFRKMKDNRTKSKIEYLCSMCKDCEKKRSLEKYYENREERLEYSKKYKKENKDKINQNRRKYSLDKMKSPEEKIKRNMKTLLCLKIKKIKRSGEYFGTSLDIIIKWFEFNIKNTDMTLENYGSYWQIDHTIPIKAFNILDEEEKMLCFCWMNLMPLKKIYNLKKSTTISYTRILYQEIQLRKFCKENIVLFPLMCDFLKKYTKKFNSLI